MSAAAEHEPTGRELPLARILIADDDPDILLLLGHVLQKDGYELITAANGLDALRLASERAPDLCVLDVAMPGADGYTVCRELQRKGPFAPPVIFLTARAHTTARVEGLDSGAVDYIVKPFEPTELRARVRAALRTKSARDLLAAEAVTDPLTSLFNRGQLDVAGAELVQLAVRSGRPLACLLLDLDHFKRVNDTYGHAAGDAALVHAAGLFRSAIRNSDLLVRYGGEEFCLLLPDTDTIGAITMAARMRELLEASPLSFAADPRDAAVSIPLRTSVGIAIWRSELESLDSLVDAADRALYRAKALGRDRVELAGT